MLTRGDLAQVPNKLGRLTGLRELSFQHKLVKSIPEPVLQLTALEALAITFCKLQRLPATLGAMHRLRSLNLQGNPWLQAHSLPMPALCMWVSSGHPPVPSVCLAGLPHGQSCQPASGGLVQHSCQHWWGLPLQHGTSV